MRGSSWYYIASKFKMEWWCKQKYLKLLRDIIRLEKTETFGTI
jgi:hypothetical protein